MHISKRAKAAQVPRPQASTVQTQTSGVTLNTLNRELGGVTVSESILTADGSIDLRAEKSESVLNLIYNADQADNAPNFNPNAPQDTPGEDYLWMEEFPVMRETYKSGPYTPDLLLLKYKKTILEMHNMMLRCDKNYFNQLGQFRVLEWLNCALKLMASRVVSDLRAHDQGTPLPDGIPLDALKRLKDALLTCGLDDHLIDCVSMDFGGLMTHSSLMLQWQLTANNRFTSDVLGSIETLAAQIDQRLSEHVSEVKCVALLRME